MGKNSKKAAAAQAAMSHVSDVSTRLAEEIMSSIAGTRMYESKPNVRGTVIAGDGANKTKVEVIPVDTVGAVFDCADAGDTVAVLDFASYRNPGGGYINGAWAQEEAICAESTLYPILEMTSSFYEKNKRDDYDGAYTDRSLLVPNVVFERDGNGRVADVIVSAAPNAKRMGEGRADEAREALKGRIDMVCSIAAAAGCDVFVTGAWGCGVFENEPEGVAKMFRAWISEHDGAIPKVVFAIPGETSENFVAFAKAFDEENE